MIKKLPIIILFTLLLLLAISPVVFAKRLLPQLRSAAGARVTPTRGVTTSVAFRGDRLAIEVSFSNLNIASSVSYTLSYNTRGTTQGAVGTINPAVTSDPTSREILFGTCSHGVCRYDSGITNARFVVTTTTKSGLRVIKSFKLKV